MGKFIIIISLSFNYNFDLNFDLNFDSNSNSKYYFIKL
jgi:hypothetical protein